MYKKILATLVGGCVLVVLANAGCASTSGSGKKDNYLASAQKNFDAATKLLAEERYEDARSFFDHVRSKYPYSQYAALSDLRIADAYYGEKKWVQAADSYDFFLKFHPRHDDAEIATFRLAKSYIECLPSSFFLFPKNYTRDQKAAKDALAAVETLLERFPSTKLLQEATIMKADILEKLALREIHIARFYQSRDRWMGAFSRFETVVQRYPDTECAAEALYQAAKIAQTHLKDGEKARKLFVALKENYHNSSYAKLVTEDMVVTSQSPEGQLTPAS